MREPAFLSLVDIDLLHQRSLQLYGGSQGTRDPSLLASAAHQPQNDYFYGGADLCGIAASYCYHLAEAQAYLDGNKRTAVAAALTFLAGNGVSITFDSTELYEAMIGIAEKRIGKQELAELLRKLTNP